MLNMENLKAIRKRRGLTQAQLAEASGLDQGFLSKVENGDANPTLDKITDIAAALKVHPAELFGLPALQQRAIAALNSIDPQRQEAALTVLEAMARK